MHRILVIGYIPGPNGIATSIQNLYTHLDKKIFQWDFLLPEKYRDIKSHDMLCMQKMGARFHYTDSQADDSSPGFREELKLLLASIPDICGVHVHVNTLNVYPLVCAEELDLPVRFIHTHSGADASMIAHHKPGPDQLDKLRRIDDDSIDRLACCDLSGDYTFHGLPYQILPNGVDIDRFTYNRLHNTLIRRRLGIPENVPVIGFAGSHIIMKNPLFAVRVFEAFHIINRESHMLIAGHGDLFHEMRELADSTGFSNFIHFVGFQEEMDMFYNTMDLLLCTSFYEGLPNALIEAQSCGLPCLVSDVLTDSICLTPLVKMQSLANSPDTWARQADFILRDHGVRSSSHKKIIEAGFDIRDTAKKLETLYLSRINGR